MDEDLILEASNQWWFHSDGQIKCTSYCGMTNSKEGAGVEILPWLCQLLSTLHSWVFKAHNSTNRVAKGATLEMARQMWSGIPRSKGCCCVGRTDAQIIGLWGALRSPYRCFRLRYWRVLMQEGHPVAYKSRKLDETERWYPVHEKEMTVVVHCLRVWQHYLLGSRFVLRTNNIALSYFQTQKKLSLKQARWQDFLVEFDMAMKYKPERANVVADLLSRKVERVNAI